MIRKYLIVTFLCLSAFSLCAQDADGVYTKVDEKPSPTKTAKPEFPFQLKREGVSGLVAVSCVIDESGNVVDMKVTKSSNPGFERPAMDALAQWKFSPAKKRWKACESSRYDSFPV
jgi:protein TonB